MKPKTKKIAIGVGAAAVISAILYFLLRKKPTEDVTTRTDGGLSVDTGSTSAPSVEKKIWVFTDNYFTGGFSDSGNLGFVGTGKPPFSVDEVIYVKQSEGAKYPQYNGMTKIDAIKEVDAGWVVDTTKGRRGDTPVNSGIITNYPT
tara:strand:- start:35 stop:472 length:438 start_codon:yes stop_codon:yes gene_type:complete